MLFTTFKFVIFFAVVFFLYYIVPKKFQWMLLLVGSYFFYAQTSIYCLLFLLFTTFISYLFPIFIDKKNENKSKSILLFVCIILLLSPLIIFKYGNFFIQILASISLKKFNALNLILPVGLSFYIFQSLGYCIDVYRGGVEAEKNLFKHALYVSYFPQLLQGPIGDYNRLKPQLFLEHTFDYDSVKNGLIRIAWGFFKKLVIANHISILIDGVYIEYNNHPGMLFWILISAFYAIQLYADFSGYMDISIGCSKMLGISLDENFDTPYFSKSIAEFWRRWHITLGEWFKNYVFYSLLRTNILNGIRKIFKKTNKYLSTTLPTVISLFIVWVSIGLWHGADWCYVVYGLFHGGIIILSTFLTPFYHSFNNKCSAVADSKIYHTFQIFRTFLITVVGYLIFRPANLNITLRIIEQMLLNDGIKESILFVFANKKEILIITGSTFILFFIDTIKYVFPEFNVFKYLSELNICIRYFIYFVLLFLIIIFGNFGQSSFIYFGF